MLYAAAHSSSAATLVLGIIVLLLACIGLASVGRWLSSRLAPGTAAGDPEPRTPGDDLSHDHPSIASPWAARPPRPEAPQPPTAGQGEAGTAAGGQERAAESVVGAGRSDLRASTRSAARCPPGSMERLGRALAVSRLLRGADELVARRLACLPSDRWHVERGVQIPCYRLSFVILGDTGVFAVWGGSAPPSWHHLVYVSQACAEVRALLPGYEGEVHGAYCRTLAREEVRPRWWCRPQARCGDERRTYHAAPGAWVMDLHWLVPWIEQHGPGAWPERSGIERGVGLKDLERLRAIAAQPPVRPPVLQPGKMPFVDTVPNL